MHYDSNLVNLDEPTRLELLFRKYITRTCWGFNRKRSKYALPRASGERRGRAGPVVSATCGSRDRREPDGGPPGRCPCGAGDGIRTHDILLGKQTSLSAVLV